MRSLSTIQLIPAIYNIQPLFTKIQIGTYQWIQLLILSKLTLGTYFISTFTTIL